MTPPILLCTDLDRTLLPNGTEPESALARPLIQALSARDDICLAYVSGRDRGLVQQAIAEYQIPVPAFVIADVGTTVYQIEAGQWRPCPNWQRIIAPDWNGYDHAGLLQLLADMSALRLQEASKQGCFKLSYYTPMDIDQGALLAAIEQRLRPLAIQASLIWSIDEAAAVGLLDVLPRRATKLGAIRFLMRQEGFSARQTVFAGDSGNDLPVLVSGLQSILVRNATPDVRRQALAALADMSTLYQARGGFLGMNGHYGAGILEGLAHFYPQLRAWLQDHPLLSGVED